MFAELLTYDPTTIDPAIREKVASILKARSELLAAQAEVSGLHARVWAGEEGLADLIDLKAADLMKLREENKKRLHLLLKEAVDLEGLLEMLPMLGLAVLGKFNVPLPVLLEVIGADFDAIKLAVTGLKELIENNGKDE